MTFLFTYSKFFYAILLLKNRKKNKEISHQNIMLSSTWSLGVLLDFSSLFPIRSLILKAHSIPEINI